LADWQQIGDDVMTSAQQSQGEQRLLISYFNIVV